jgi:hypothetical protein
MRLIKRHDWRSGEDYVDDGRSMASIVWAICGGLGVFFFFVFGSFLSDLYILTGIIHMAHGGRGILIFWLDWGLFILLVVFFSVSLRSFTALYHTIRPWLSQSNQELISFSFYQLFKSNILVHFKSSPLALREMEVLDSQLQPLGAPGRHRREGGGWIRKRGDPLPSFQPSLPRD